MGKYITLGIYNNLYKYIILFLIFRILNKCLYELNHYDMLKGIAIKYILQFFSNKFFSQQYRQDRQQDENQQKAANAEDQAVANGDSAFYNIGFEEYDFIRQMVIAYFGTFILSCIFLICHKIKIKREEKKEKNKGRLSSTENPIILIHEGIENEEKRISFFYILLIIFCWVFEEQALEKYNTNLCHLDFWFFELIIIVFLNKAMLQIEIYKHQMFSFFFCLFPMFLKIITIIIELLEGTNKEDEKSNFVYEDGWYWIPLGLLIYFVLIVLKAYAIIKIKWLMDSKYISAYNILINYGLIGTVFYSIFCILSIFIENKDFSLFISPSYNYIEYFRTFLVSNKAQIIVEIIILILVMITSYYIKYNTIMIIKYLTPVHISFLLTIYYFISKLILLIYNIGYSIFENTTKNFFGGTKIRHASHKFFLDFSGDFFSFFGYLIYLEIIELNFCGLNYNLRNKIIRRADNEFMNIDDDISCTEDSINEDNNSNNSDESLENIINISNNSNMSY